MGPPLAAQKCFFRRSVPPDLKLAFDRRTPASEGAFDVTAEASSERGQVAIPEFIFVRASASRILEGR